MSPQSAGSGPQGHNSPCLRITGPHYISAKLSCHGCLNQPEWVSPEGTEGLLIMWCSSLSKL